MDVDFYLMGDPSFKFHQDELIVGPDALVLSVIKNNINTVELGFRYSQIEECRVTRNPVFPDFIKSAKRECCLKFFLERSAKVYSEVFLCEKSPLCHYNIRRIEKTMSFGCTTDTGDILLSDDYYMEKFDHENELCKGYVCKPNDEMKPDFVPIWLQKPKKDYDGDLEPLE